MSSLVRPSAHAHSLRVVRLITALVVAVLAGTLMSALTPAADAAPGGASELDFSRYQPVNAQRFQSLRYDDDGRAFFVAGQWRCALGPNPGSVACKGRPATAPPDVLGVAIVGDMQGPWWVRPGSTFRFNSRAGFRAPVLKVGQRITIANTVCAVPRRNVVACASANRAFILTRAWHKFYWPKYDRAHSNNPPARYLPARLR